INGDVNVSTNNADPLVTPVSGQDSSLTVRDGATFAADNIYVNEDGLLTGGDGFIVGDVHLDGGTIAPGNSPGTMNIDGDLFLNDGILDLEIEEGARDLFVVTGDVTLGEDLMINLIFGYDPMEELFDLSDFFDAENLFSDFNSETNLMVNGLGGDAFLTIVGFGGEQIQIGEPGTGEPPAIPAPLSLILFGTGLAGLGLAWRRRRFV
ncbi:MAG: PEP-CTERM sorting domain-containing protein, partial [Sphingomonadales bacterium]